MRTKDKTEIEHFHARGIRAANGCLEFSNRHHNGYADFYFQGARQKAHRVAWQIAFGSIPQGLQILHRCDNMRCVEPSHLFLGTSADNNADMGSKGRHGAQRDPFGWASRMDGYQSKPGEKNPSAKLTAVDVRKMRKLRQRGIKMRELADYFGVTKSTVFRIIHAEQHGGWSHV